MTVLLDPIEMPVLALSNAVQCAIVEAGPTLNPFEPFVVAEQFDTELAAPGRKPVAPLLAAMHSTMLPPRPVRIPELALPLARRLATRVLVARDDAMSI